MYSVHLACAHKHEEAGTLKGANVSFTLATVVQDASYILGSLACFY